MFGAGAAGMLFKGFDIPLQVLTGERFEQPILFGANNLSGIVQTNVAYAGRWRTLQRPRAVGRRVTQAVTPAFQFASELVGDILPFVATSEARARVALMTKHSTSGF